MYAGVLVVMASVVFVDSTSSGPGMNYAFQYMSVACATSLVMLEISKATDESGAVLEPKLEMVDKVIK